MTIITENFQECVRYFVVAINKIAEMTAAATTANKETEMGKLFACRFGLA